MKPIRPTRSADIYQLKVTLRGTKPPVWRRILVRSDTTLPRLHRILQATMGWSDCHLHLFKIGPDDYGDPDPEYGDDLLSERRVRLRDFVDAAGFKFIYEYDFGDSWLHNIRVEKILLPEPGVKYPICLAGKRAGPPEDCGGVHGYYGLVAALQDPHHPDHDVWSERMDGGFAEALDVDAANRELASLG